MVDGVDRRRVVFPGVFVVSERREGGSLREGSLEVRVKDLLDFLRKSDANLKRSRDITCDSTIPLISITITTYRKCL